MRSPLSENLGYMLVTNTDHLEVSEHLMPQAHFYLQRALEELWPRVGSTDHCVRLSRLSAALQDIVTQRTIDIETLNPLFHAAFPPPFSGVIPTNSLDFACDYDSRVGSGIVFF